MAEISYQLVPYHEKAYLHGIQIDSTTAHQGPNCEFFTDILYDAVLFQATRDGELPDLEVTEIYQHELSRFRMGLAFPRYFLGQRPQVLRHRTAGFRFNGVDEPMVVDGTWQQLLPPDKRDPELPKMLSGSPEEVKEKANSFGVSEQMLAFIGASRVVHQQTVRK